MKSKLKKIGLLCAAIMVGIALNSFTILKKKTTTEKNQKVVSKFNDWEEYNKVNEYVRKKICAVIKQSKTGSNDNKMDYMSRCPSGYQPAISDKTDSVKVDKMVYGKINYYKGCGRNYICDFKVCVSKGIAEVKTKDMKEYVSVKEWLANKEKTPTVVKG